MVAALHRIIHLGEGFRQAAEHVNALSATFKPHTIHRSSVHRTWQRLPDELRCPSTSTEARLLEFLHTDQSQRKEDMGSGPSLLTSVEEELFVQWMQREVNMNAPITPEEAKDQARLIMQQRTGVVYTGSLRHWYSAFRVRHPELTERVAEIMPSSRLNAEQKDGNIAHFFTLLARFRHLTPSQIYAADETGLDGDGSRRQKVIVPTNTPRVYKKGSSYREHTSILHMANALGESVPPVFIFKAKKKVDANIVQQMAEFAPEGLYGVQENGYFTSINTSAILQHLDKHSASPRPLLLIMDGAGGHLDAESAKLAISLGIDILLLPSHTTHILQVADVAVFRPFKEAWKGQCAKRRREKRLSTARGHCGIHQTDIVPMAMTAWAAAMTSSNVTSGFRRTGIFPYDPLAYKRTVASHLRTDTLTGLPPLLSPASFTSQQLQESSLLLSLTTSSAFSDPSPTTPPTKKVKRKLNTSAGALLTGVESLEQMRRWDEEKEEEEEAKRRRKEQREKRKEEIRREGEEKVRRREEREAKKVAKEQAQQTKGVREKKRKTTEVKRGGIVDDDSNEENSHPNLPPTSSAPSSSPTAFYTCSVVTVGQRLVLRLRRAREEEMEGQSVHPNGQGEVTYLHTCYQWWNRVTGGVSARV
jgi:outer membrane biosynthesis protein TonB